MAGWLLTFAVMTIGGWFAWFVLGAGLCEDDDSPGSDTYCNQGGWEASGLAFASLAVLALLLPAAGVAAGEPAVVLDRPARTDPAGCLGLRALDNPRPGLACFPGERE